MDKKKKNLVIGAVVLLVLVAVMVLLLLTAPEDEDELLDNSSDTETINLIDEEDNSLRSLHVTNEYGTYTIENIGEKLWGITAYEDYNTDSSDYETTVGYFTYLDAVAEVLDSVEDKEKYGLADPAATAEIEFSGGNSYTLYLGDEAPDGSGYYAVLDGDSSLYTISFDAALRLLQNSFDYIDKTIISEYTTESDEEDEEEEEASEPDYQLFQIQRKDLEYDYLFEPIPSSVSDSSTSVYSASLWMVEPKISEIDWTRGEQNLMDSLFGLTAMSIADIDADQKLEEYGLDDPFAVITLQYDSRVAVMTFGDQVPDTDDSYYMIFNDNNLVYEVSAADVQALTVEPSTVVSRLGLLPNIDTVTNVILTVDGEECVFDLTAETDDEAFSVQYDGKELDGENFKQFYQLLIYPNLEELAFDEPEDDPEITIMFVYNDTVSEESNTVELYRSGRTMYYGVDGYISRIGRSAYLDKIVKELANVLSGETVTVDW